MKLFTATLGTETNTFAPLPTNLESFQDLVHLSGEQVTALGRKIASGTVKALLDMQDVNECEAVFGMAAYAQPGGITTKAAYEALRDELLNDLKSALPIDGAILHLHGAMVAEGYDDCEGDILSRARKIIGPDCPLGLVIDPHCHLSDEMLENTDAIKCYLEYPHTDVDERSDEMAALIRDQVQGKIKPVQSVFDCRMIAMFHTTEDPMKAFVDKIRSVVQNDPKVISISVAHGFPWGDVPAMGTKILVITDNDKDYGDELAQSLGMELFDIRNAAKDKLQSVEQAIERARHATEKPVIIADASDNPGGGAPSDATHLIRAILDAGLGNAAAAFIWDPHAVSIASKAGEGAVLDLRVGGKTSSLCGDPLDLRITVKKVVDNAVEDFAGVAWKTGPLVCVEADGIDLVLITNRIQCFTPAAFEQAGIDPSAKDYLIVKSSQHFYAGFAPIAGTVIYADPPGVVTSLLETLPFEKIARPKWPLDAHPFETGA